MINMYKVFYFVGLYCLRTIPRGIFKHAVPIQETPNTRSEAFNAEKNEKWS